MKLNIQSAIIVLTAMVFILDLFTPRGVAVWIFYLIPLLLTNWAAKRLNSFVCAAVFTGLTVLGFFFSPQGVSMTLCILNRATGVSAFWLVALLIARRMAAADALSAGTEEFQDLYDNAPNGYVSVCGDGLIKRCNKRFGEMLGYETEKLLGMPVVNLYADTPDGREKAKKVFQLFLSGETITGEELQMQKSDGTLFWISLSVNAVRDSRGQVLESRSVVQDVTERKKSGEAVQRSEQILRLFVEHSPAAIAMFDNNMKYIVASRRYLTDYELNYQDLTGLSHYAVFPEMSDRWKEIHRRCLAGAIERCDEDPFPRLDGRLDWVQWEIRPWYKTHGKIGGIILFSEVITERRRAQEKIKLSEVLLNETQKLSKVGGWEYHVEQRRLTWTEEVYRIYGVSPTEYDPNDIGQDIANYEESTVIENAFRRAVEYGEPYDLELKFRNARGESLWVRTIGKAEQKGGKTVRVFGNIMDITDRKKAEEELNKYREHLEVLVKDRTAELKDSQTALTNIVEDLDEKSKALHEANLKLREVDRLKSIFIASMSHELRTPLNSIIGFSSILQNEWLGPLSREQKENLQTILRAGKHLLNLINDVIDVSKIEAGKVESLSEDFDLHGLVMEAVDLVKKEASEKGLEFLVESTHVEMHTDRRRLMQCIVNLLSNAVKFTEKGSVRVQARLVDSDWRSVIGEKELTPDPQRPTPHGDFVEISVEDTGTGIMSDDLPKLFTSFIRLESPLKAKVPGTGLGLYLTKKIVAEVLKGNILVSSRHGEGSRFTLLVPTIRG